MRLPGDLGSGDESAPYDLLQGRTRPRDSTLVETIKKILGYKAPQTEMTPEEYKAAHPGPAPAAYKPAPTQYPAWTAEEMPVLEFLYSATRSQGIYKDVKAFAEAMKNDPWTREYVKAQVDAQRKKAAQPKINPGSLLD